MSAAPGLSTGDPIRSVGDLGLDRFMHSNVWVATQAKLLAKRGQFVEIVTLDPQRVHHITRISNENGGGFGSAVPTRCAPLESVVVLEELSHLQGVSRTLALHDVSSTMR